MEPTNDDLKRSGAVRATCLAYHKYSSLYPTWDSMKTWAEREFRQYSTETIARLIELSREACDNAYFKRFNCSRDNEGNRLSDNPEGGK